MVIPKEKLPRHVAVILDGNRRFAKKLSLPPWKGHELGKQKVEELLQWCQDFAIHELTLYAFSAQNFSRAQEEVDYLMDLFVQACHDLVARHDPALKIMVVGRKYLLPKKVQEAVQLMEEATKHNGPFVLNLGLAYGGREEILDAVKEIASKVKTGILTPDAISLETITAHMQVLSEPDLIIRPGGERRTSNFLVWQSSYSEWIFLEKFWPELTKDDFTRCLEEFALRNRRFGGS
jgi:tritrans,polycis-undecaprenyl-diphosphate synthase [geranylgeranyl-diphosphate specific]